MRLLSLIGFLLLQYLGLAQTITRGGRLHPASDEATVALQRTADDGFIVLSASRLSDTFYLTAYSPGFQPRWRFGHDGSSPDFAPQDFLVLPNGHIVFTGAVWLYGRHEPPSIGMMRVDSTGRRWAFRPLGGKGDDYPGGIHPLADGNFIVFGASSSDAEVCKGEVSRGGLDYWWLTLDSSFRVQRDKTIGGTGNDRMTGILDLGEDQWICWGESDSPASGDKQTDHRGGMDGWLVKTDGRGEPVWQVALASAFDDQIASVLVNDEGDMYFFVSSGSKNDPAQSAIAVYHLSAEGDILSTTPIDVPGLDRLGNVLRTPDKGFIMTMTVHNDTLPAHTTGQVPQGDIRVIRLDHQLQHVWQTAYTAEGDKSNPLLHRMAAQSYMLTFDSVTPHAPSKSSGARSRHGGMCWVRVNDDALPNTFTSDVHVFRQLLAKDPTRYAFPVSIEDSRHD